MDAPASEAPPAKVIGVRLPPELLHPIEELAAKEERPRQYFIRKAVEDWLRRSGHLPPKRRQ